MDLNEIKIINLDNSHIERVSNIAAECFCNDKFFSYLGEDVDIRKQKLKTMYEKACLLCLKLGFIFGAVSGDRLVSVMLLLDYDKLKKSKSHYKQVFNVEKNDHRDDTYKFLEEANAFENAIYLLAIFTEPDFQKKGFASRLISFLSKRFDRPIISDVDNANSLNMYRREHFNIRKLSDITYFVSK